MQSLSGEGGRKTRQDSKGNVPVPGPFTRWSCSRENSKRRVYDSNGKCCSRTCTTVPRKCKKTQRRGRWPKRKKSGHRTTGPASNAFVPPRAKRKLRGRDWRRPALATVPSRAPRSCTGFGGEESGRRRGCAEALCSWGARRRKRSCGTRAPCGRWPSCSTGSP